MFRFATVRLDPNAAANGGGGAPASPAPAPAPAPAAARREPVPIPHGTIAAQLIARWGSAEAALQQLSTENARVRHRNRELKEQLEGYQTRNPQGSVVLHGQDLADYNAYKALGKPADVKAAVERVGALEAEVAAGKETKLYSDSSKALGWNEKVLRDLTKLRELSIEIREEQVDGAKKPVVYAKGKAANAAWEPLATLVNRDAPEYLPALKAVSADGNSNGSSASSSALGGILEIQTPPPSQSGDQSLGGLADRFLKNLNESGAKRGNPLVPAAAAGAK